MGKGCEGVPISSIDTAYWLPIAANEPQIYRQSQLVRPDLPYKAGVGRTELTILTIVLGVIKSSLNSVKDLKRTGYMASCETFVYSHCWLC